MPRQLRYMLAPASPVNAAEARLRHYEAQLAEVLARQSVAVAALAVVERPMLADPEVQAALRRAPRLRRRARSSSQGRRGTRAAPCV